MTKLDIGAGAHPAPGYISVDLNPRFADVVASADDLPFPDGSVEAIRAVDVLEHVSYRQTDAVLAEWARVAAPGCELFVQCPDADLIMRRYFAAVTRPRMTAVSKLLPVPDDLPQTPLAGATWRLLGGHDDGERVDTAAGDDWRWNAHFSFWSRDSLTDALDRAGFDVIRCPTNPFPNLCCEAVKR